MGGIGFMEILLHWHTLPLVVLSGYWREAKDEVATQAEDIAIGRIYATLVREDELSDETCFITIRCEDEADLQRLKTHFGSDPIKVEFPDEDDQ